MTKPAKKKPTKKGPPPGSAGGRPYEMTPERHRTLVRMVAMGSTFSDACIEAGVSWTLFLRWRRVGEKHLSSGIGPEASAYARFWSDLLRAESHAKNAVIATVREGAMRDPHLALKWLTSRYPEEYGRRVADVKVGGRVALDQTTKLEVSLGDLLDVSALPDHLLAETMALIEKIDAWKAGRDLPGLEPDVIDVKPDDPEPPRDLPVVASRLPRGPADVEAELADLLDEDDDSDGG